MLTNLRKLHLENLWFFGRVVLGFGLAGELWYITSKEDTKVTHLFFVGYKFFKENKAEAYLLTITLLYLTINIGFITRLPK